MASSAAARKVGMPTCRTPAPSPSSPVLWLQTLELLGRVAKGSTARFREDGTLPD
jgi:hypothetical protein